MPDKDFKHYEDKAWEQMKDLLDKELPVNRRRPVFIVYAISAVACLFLLLYFVIPKQAENLDFVLNESITVVNNKTQTNSNSQKSESDILLSNIIDPEEYSAEIDSKDFILMEENQKQSIIPTEKYKSFSEPILASTEIAPVDIENANKNHESYEEENLSINTNLKNKTSNADLTVEGTLSEISESPEFFIHDRLNKVAFLDPMRVSPIFSLDENQFKHTLPIMIANKRHRLGWYIDAGINYSGKNGFLGYNLGSGVYRNIGKRFLIESGLAYQHLYRSQFAQDLLSVSTNSDQESIDNGGVLDMNNTNDPGTSGQNQDRAKADFSDLVSLSYLNIPIVCTYKFRTRHLFSASVKYNYLISAKNKFINTGFSAPESNLFASTDNTYYSGGHLRKSEISVGAGYGYRMNRRLELYIVGNYGLAEVILPQINPIENSRNIYLGTGIKIRL